MTQQLSAADLVRRAALAHPELADPRDLVPFVLEDLSGREEEMLQRLLPSYIADVLRRRGEVADEEQEWGAFLAERVPTRNGTVFLRDASADDLDAGAERRRAFGGALDARAQKFAATATAVREAAVATAGELPKGRGVDLLRELDMTARTAQRGRLQDSMRARQIGSLRRSVENLTEILRSGEDPRVPLLRAYRDDLLGQREKLKDTIARGRKTDEWQRGMVNAPG